MNKISRTKNTLLLLFLFAAVYLFLIESLPTGFLCGWGNSMSTIGCRFNAHLAWTESVSAIILIVFVLGIIGNYFKKFLTAKKALFVIGITVVALAPLTVVHLTAVYNNSMREQAVATADPTKCDRTMLEPGLIENCKLNAIKKIGDPNSCALLPDALNNFTKDDCYTWYSLEKPETFCETITSEFGRNICYETVAQQKRNQIICQKITNKERVPHCVESVNFIIQERKKQ